MRKRPMLKDMDAKIREMSTQGMNYRDIADKLGKDPSGVWRYMNDRGIPTNPKERHPKWKKKCGAAFNLKDKECRKCVKETP